MTIGMQLVKTLKTAKENGYNDLVDLLQKTFGVGDLNSPYFDMHRLNDITVLHVIETDHVMEMQQDRGKVQIRLLTKTGGWLPFIEIDPDDEKIFSLYRLPLLLKIGHASQEFQS